MLDRSNERVTDQFKLRPLFVNSIDALLNTTKALELFLQDLCDRTYDITVQRGAKTEVVSKVPDYGNSDAAADISKRRKVVANESIDSDEESKRSTMQETGHASGIGRGEVGVEVEGRGRASRTTEREPPRHELESSSTTSQQGIKQISSPARPADNNSESNEASKENLKVMDVKVVDGVTSDSSRNFDLNAGVDESSDKMASSTGPSTDVKGEEYPGLSEMDRMAIDPVHLTQLNSRLDEEEEDYDEEG
ncbi:hypothetical protein DH2020_044764 [Rehmannia glutinosa]|uniref:Uncharacterized protein n=1 Tax=Rehmannia glutinosa TaxID=99300 RepID=A0ABR0UH37_REHGL